MHSLYEVSEYKMSTMRSKQIDTFELPPIFSMLNWATLVACEKNSYTTETFAYAEFVMASLIFQTYDSIFYIPYSYEMIDVSTTVFIS